MHMLAKPGGFAYKQKGKRLLALNEGIKILGVFVAKLITPHLIRARSGGEF